MQQTEIKNNMNITIVLCRDMGSQIQAISFKKGYVGYYHKASNITFDKNGKLYAFGDATQTLVREAAK